MKPLVILYVSAEDRIISLRSTRERYIQRSKSKDAMEPELYRVLKVCFLSFAVWEGKAVRPLDELDGSRVQSGEVREGEEAHIFLKHI